MSGLGVAQLLAQPFLLHALIAGGAIAIAAGLAGYFLVLRGQVFTGDALGHVAFAGAAAALAFGVDARIGLFVACIALGLGMGWLGERGKADDIVIGNVLAVVLGVGVFFLALFVTGRSAGNGAAGTAVLFGSIFGLSSEATWTAVGVSLVTSIALLTVARPLLFASIDPVVAAARGVHVRALGILFLALVGVVTAEATQAVGALLLLGLLAAPAGTAQRLTSRPYRALLFSAGIALADVWLGLALSVAVPSLPPSFSIIAVAAAVYALAFAFTREGRPTRETPPRREALAVLVAAVIVTLVVVWRARLGVSFYDDSHYVALSWRLANGAKPLADEMSLQSLGFLIPAAFVWVWTHLVGMTRLVIAYRLFYVVLALGTGIVVYRALRPSFRPAIAGLGALLPLICTPFNLIAPSYDTLALLGFALAFSLSFAAWRDRGRVTALFAGAAMTLMSVSYPPMVLAALTLLGTLWWVSRDRRTVALTALGGGVTLVAMLAPLARLITIADVQRALAYASANVHGFGSPVVKLGFAAGAVLLALVVPGLLPMWALVVAASWRGLAGRWRAFVLLALPVAATVPGLLWAAGTSRRALFGNTAASWLITFALGCLVPLWLWVRRTEHPQIRRLLQLATPCALVGFAIVSYSTDASLVRAVPVIGLVPLSMAVLMGWAEMVGELRIAYRHVVALALLLGSAIVLLYTTSVDDRRPLTLNSTMTTGAYRGMRMSWARRQALRGVEAAGRRWVRPTDRVTFLGERNGYLLVGGIPYTNAVWLYVGPSDQAALDYFARHGGMPDVVFVDHTSYVKVLEPDYRVAARTDPLLARILAEYRLAETVDDFSVFVRR